MLFSKNWAYAQRRNKLFVYRKGAMEPTFVFERTKKGSSFWRNGKKIGNLKEIQKWVEFLCTYEPQN